MQITLDLPPDIEQYLLRQAEQSNVPLPTLILQALRQMIQMPPVSTSQWSMELRYGEDKMNLDTHPSSKRRYDVLIEHQADGEISATVLGWQDCQAQAPTKEEALKTLRQLIDARLQNTEIVSLEIDLPQGEHPWMRFAGMFKDDSDFEEVLADINYYRQEIDREAQESFRHLEGSEETE